MAFLKWRGTAKRGKYYAVWWERISSGKRKKKWRPLSRDKKLAQRMLREIERNSELKGAGLARSIPWEEFKTQYMKVLVAECSPSTVQRVDIIFKHLVRHFPVVDLMDITPQVLDQYKIARIEEEIDPATINRELSAIRAAIRKARKWGYQTHDLSDVEKMKVPEKFKVCFTKEEVLLMLQKADPLFRMIILLGVYAGLRMNEMLQLRWQDIDWPNHTMILGDGWQTKTGRIRVLPLHPKLEHALQTWQAASGSNKNIVPWDRTSHQMSGMFVHFLRKRCGIARGSLHSLRHTFVTFLKKKDVSGPKVQKLAGHTSSRTTEIYTHLDVGDLDEAVKRLDFEASE